MSNMPKSETVGWSLHDAVVTIDGETCAVKVAYEKVMALLSGGTVFHELAAQKLLRTIIEQAPKFGEGHFQLARLDLKFDERDSALQHAIAAVREGHGAVNYRLLLAALYGDAGKNDEAAALVDSLVEDRPDEFPFRNALPIGPMSARVEIFLGHTLRRILSQYVFYNGYLESKEHHIHTFIQDINNADQVDTSVAQAQAYLESAPEFEELRFYLVKYLLDRSRLTEAWQSIRLGGEGFPKEWPNHVLAGLLCAHNGETEQAFAHFRSAALGNEKLPLFKLESLNEKDTARVVAWFAKLIESLPSYAGAYRDGWVYPPLFSKGALVGSKENGGATLALALADIRETIQERRGWIALARNDIASRYRRTVLGPWWIILGTGLALTGMAFVWSAIFGMTMAEFFPYITSGYVTWMFISAIMMEGSTTFSGQAMTIMKNIPMSKTLHVARLVLRNFLIFIHTMAIFLVVALIFWIDVNYNTLLVVPGVLLMLFTASAVALLFGIIGLRYRDFGPALGAVMTVLFLLTPIMWKADQLGARSHYAFFNPMTHYISIVRDPLLGQAPSILSYGVVAGGGIVLWLLALWAFAKARNRLVFWI